LKHCIYLKTLFELIIVVFIIAQTTIIETLYLHNAMFELIIVFIIARFSAASV